MAFLVVSVIINGWEISIVYLKNIFIILLLLSVVCLNAQQDPEFSQNTNVIGLYNPGSAGSMDQICLTAVHREQWVGFTGAPSSSFFNANGSFNLFGANHGAGISILNDSYGFNTDLAISASYAYRIDLGSGKLGIGFNAGILNKALNPEWNIPEGLGDVQGDPSIPKNNESRVAFDMGLGAFYRSEQIFFGVSVTHLNKARIKYEDATPYMVRHYYATAGYRLQLINPLYEIMPSFVIKTDGNANQLYLNTMLRYNKKFWGGVSYRAGDAIVGLFGLELFNGLRITYSYDVVTSRISKYSDGSHEFSLGYCFDVSLDKTPQKYKSVRFL